MPDIAIYGAGGFGRETALLIEQINEEKKCWNFLGFFDDGKVAGTPIDESFVLGGMEQLNSRTTNFALVLAVADPKTRRGIFNKINHPGVSFPTLIHPSVWMGKNGRCRIGQGSIITGGCILTTNIEIGAFSIINLSCTIGHDVSLGDFTSIMPGCSFSGFIKGGSDVYVGTGARILPNVKLGNGCVVGAGAVVSKDVAPNDTVVGVPARSQKK